jgi:hypothetical protein
MHIRHEYVRMFEVEEAGAGCYIFILFAILLVFFDSTLPPFINFD